MSPRTSEIFEFNKIILIYLITTLACFLHLLKSIQSKKLILKRTPLDWPIIIFLLSQVLSVIFSIDKHTSIFGYYGRFNGGLLSIISYTLLFYIFVSNFSAKNVLKILRISLVTSLVVALWGLPGKFGVDLTCGFFTGSFGNNCWTDQFRPAERMFSTLGQPNWLGIYLVVNFFIGLYFYLKSKSLLYPIYLILNFAGILFSRSRSSLGALVGGLIVFISFLYLSIRRDKKLLDESLRKIGAVFIGFLILILIFKTGIEKIDRFINLDFKNQVKQKSALEQKSTTAYVTESFDIRKIVWKGAIDLGIKNPLFGTGVETFAYSYYFVRPIEHNLTSEWDYLYNKAHNEFLNYFATTGFVGLFAYLFMIGSVLRLLWINLKINKDSLLINLIFLSSYVAILIANFFGFSTTTINLFFYLIPAFSLVLKENSIEHEGDIQVAKMSKKQQFQLYSTALFAVYLLVSLFRYYFADLRYALADNYHKTGQYKESAILFDKALNLRTEHVYQDKFSYTLANLLLSAYDNKRKDEMKNLITVSLYYNDLSIKKSPKNVLYWKTNSKINYIFYQLLQEEKYLDNALYSLEVARSLSPTDPKIPLTKTVMYAFYEGDRKKKAQYQALSLLEIDKAINLKNNYRDAHFLKGKVLKKYGKRDEARKVFEFIIQRINPNDEETKKELESL